MTTAICEGSESFNGNVKKTITVGGGGGGGGGLLSCFRLNIQQVEANA